MTSEPLRVSVALCTFDGVDFLEPQLESILAQSSPPDEMVIADDGSTDGTLEIVDRFVERAPFPVTVVRDPGPGGVTANFERAMVATTGDVIVLSDQDDVWTSDRIAATRRRFAADDTLDLLFADADLIDAGGAPIGLRLFEALEISAHERAQLASGDAVPVFLRRNLATGAATAVRRRLVDRSVPFPHEWVHDEWLAMVAAITGSIAMDESVVVRYRQHGRNQIGMRTPGLRQKISRVLEPRGGRNHALAARGRALADRLADGSIVAPTDVVRAAEEKAVFESLRADMSPRRLRRVGTIAALALTGQYRRFASRGDADVLRDLLQPET
ncbi:glycosyltransferase involved in cell wall biosynthesis [Labedella gwakjiensis]|uniref:Glycosyltransferase family 2 protein n=1 Tax=Labedella gwakjiensis TaxID=390269 RepID=A0A2P8GXX5_9MICO|nr:glycosyltransferase family 2 protein [Labedella gwakjiensis]PSL38795.1 glycosyltransferase involved in cell wall biosynthesis [Labedella gwakjiensis]RUQ86732.1 glycosyltransferase family 2 protein [Labedella gwakjiensis]